MKKQLFAIALLGALAGLSSCSEEEELSSLAPTQKGIQINAEIVPYNQPDHSRTNIDNDGKVKWAEGDQLYIGHGRMGYQSISHFDYHNGRFADSPNNQFYSPLEFSEKKTYNLLASTSMSIGYYQKCTERETDESIKIETDAPVKVSSQEQDDDLDDKGLGRYDLMTGFTSLMGGPDVKSVNLKMHHQLSLLSFDIQNQTGKPFCVKYLTLYAPDGTKLAGDVYPTYVKDAAGNVVLDAELTFHRERSQQSNNLTVKVLHANEIANGETYKVRALTIPFKLKDNDPFTIEVATNTGFYKQTFNVKGNLEFKAGALSTATVKVDQQDLYDKNNVYIADPGLRNYLLNDVNVNKNQDKKLSQEELDGVTNLLLWDNNIQTLEGIENLTNLKYIDVKEKLIQKVDLTQNTQLTHITFFQTSNLQELKVNGLSALEILDVGATDYEAGVPLTELDLSGCTSLQELKLTNLSDLKTLDLSGKSQLKSVEATYCHNLLNANLQGSTALTNLAMYSLFALNSLDVTGLSKLTTLDVHYNYGMKSLTATDCSELTNIIAFKCTDMQQIDLSGCTKLQKLDTHNCDLRQLNVKGNKALTNLKVADNKNLQELDVSGLDKLNELGIENCGITSLKLSGCSMLSNLYATNNKLTELDVSECNHDLGMDNHHRFMIYDNPNFKTIYVWEGFVKGDYFVIPDGVEPTVKKQTTTPDTPAQ